MSTSQRISFRNYDAQTQRDILSVAQSILFDPDVYPSVRPVSAARLTWRMRMTARNPMSQTVSYPRKVGNQLVWACCESAIGPKCGHLA
jgi:hypothetical protein